MVLLSMSDARDGIGLCHGIQISFTIILCVCGEGRV